MFDASVLRFLLLTIIDSFDCVNGKALAYLIEENRLLRRRIEWPPLAARRAIRKDILDFRARVLVIHEARSDPDGGV